MKSKTILFLIALIPAIVNAQWFWLNPLPQGNTLHSIKMVSATHGWAVGYFGTIINTTDGGETWNEQPSGVTKELMSVHFIDQLNGIAVGYYGTIIKTNDGGKNWKTIQTGNDTTLVKVIFINKNIGFIVGNIGLIMKSTDGGNSWTRQKSGTDYSFHDLHFFDINNGIAICSKWEGNDNTKILTTTNGGSDWVIDKTIISSFATAITFRDSLNGAIVGFEGLFLKTTDRGKSWISLPIADDYTLFDIHFSNSSNGFTIGSIWTGDIFILNTTDEGITWTKKLNNINKHLYSMSFDNSGKFISVGENGFILSSKDNGNTFDVKSSQLPYENYQDIFFINKNVGLVIGTNGKIIRTIDGGKNWNETKTETAANLRRIKFLDYNTGIVVGDFGTILKTSDSGLTWKIQPCNFTQSLSSVAFADSNYGVAVGPQGLIIQTNNGGKVWERKNSNISNQITDVTYLGNNRFMAISGPLYYDGIAFGHSQILTSSDLGNTWSTNSSGSVGTLQRISFLDQNNGFILSREGNLLKTKDGGTTWESKNSPSYETFSGIYFYDKNNGMVTTGFGSIYKTSNGGETWSKQIQKTSYGLNSIYFTDQNIGYAVGSYGTILKTISGNLVSIDKSNSIVPTSFSLSQNFPNPFNPETTISYSLPKSEHVTLKVFDLLGREVATLVNEYKQAGTYNSKFSIINNKLSSGVYFYQLSAESYVETKKLIILK